MAGIPRWHSRTDGPRKSRGGLAGRPFGSLRVDTQSGLEASESRGTEAKWMNVTCLTSQSTTDKKALYIPAVNPAPSCERHT